MLPVACAMQPDWAVKARENYILFFFGLVRAVNQFKIFEKVKKSKKMFYYRACWIYGKNNRTSQRRLRKAREPQVYITMLDLRLNNASCDWRTQLFIHSETDTESDRNLVFEFENNADCICLIYTRWDREHKITPFLIYFHDKDRDKGKSDNYG